MTETYRREYYTEVYKIMLAYGSSYIAKIPHKLFEKIKERSIENYDFEFNPQLSFKQQNVKKEAVALLTALEIKYFSSEEEKNEIRKMLKDNKLRIEKEREEKYSYDNLFNNRSTSTVSNDSNEVIEEEKKEENLQIYKENSIINKIKAFFRKLFKRSR